MSKHPWSGRTKDELFVLCLHTLATQSGSHKNAVNIYAVGRTIGQNDKGTKTIVRDLAQANFVVKHGEQAAALTNHGVALVARLQHDQAKKFF
jgi:hypothetical protein